MLFEVAVSAIRHSGRNGKTVAERQAALAGYRLADEIQKYVR